MISHLRDLDEFTKATLLSTIYGVLVQDIQFHTLHMGTSLF